MTQCLFFPRFAMKCASCSHLYDFCALRILVVCISYSYRHLIDSNAFFCRRVGKKIRLRANMSFCLHGSVLRPLNRLCQNVTGRKVLTTETQIGFLMLSNRNERGKYSTCFCPLPCAAQSCCKFISAGG